MTLPISNKNPLAEMTHTLPFSEVKTNTFVINLQQAQFDFETNLVAATNPNDGISTSSSKKLRHFLTGTELSAEEVSIVLKNAKALKQTPSLYSQALENKSLAMIFEKPSFRTRLSFAMAIQSMGGIAIESVGNTRKQETPADMARVLNGYAHFIMVRTHADEILQEMAAYAKVPVINGLSALHHPCQIMADLLTLWEQFGSFAGLTLAYIGDGNNILHSLMLLAPQLGITINYCCPASRQPDALIVAQAQSKKPGMIYNFSKPETAVKNVDAVYTDVWTSMGFEDQENNEVFQGFQVNESLMSHAKKEAVFMHCMPMERGKEVSVTLPDSPASIIFKQSENRMHVQKSLLLFLNS
ncbi:ornithine carbamoyltransferase [Fluoribacter dumoffii]|uniref:Ornithine carbamoyltransferase n=1 Tax=Fluoribacter dumoffii TaxID=463 RepID=A0A377GBI5_9GAMM|nr:ornithine carbamoyltransferase [Fluoribacter dumoffii]KTC90493.1 Ornithine carbamoyltransferase [Fluoribacter dumoffii NY 23]STO22172.1 Ornithine carbamoyltransferase [Fluoribacter dumoffii]